MKVLLQEDLQTAYVARRWALPKNTRFHLRRWSSDELRGPCAVLRAGTLVGVVKLYRRGQAALLSYTDRSGKIWWSWTHAHY